jgi:hypothetical protein
MKEGKDNEISPYKRFGLRLPVLFWERELFCYDNPLAVDWAMTDGRHNDTPVPS